MTASTQILVPLDGSNLAMQALPYARALAGAAGRITLLQVVRSSAPLRDATGAEIVPEDIVGEWILKEARQYLDETAAEFRQTLLAGVEVDTAVTTGDPASAILKAAEDRHADFIVITSHARGAIGRAAFGSVADRIARTSTIPVVITRPGDDSEGKEQPAISRIILPLDLSDLSREAVPVAQAMALHLGASVHVIHVIDNFSSYMAINGVPVSQALIDEWYADAKRELGKTEGDLKAAGVQATAAIYQGSALANISEIAKPGDLIVMTSHGRSGFTRWLIGSTAEKLVRLAPVPVCLVPARRPIPVTAEQATEYVTDATEVALQM